MMKALTARLVEEFAAGADETNGCTCFRGSGAVWDAMDVLGAEVVVQMDADFSHDPVDARKLLEHVAAGADVAIGSRYVEGGSLDERWHTRRRLLSRWGNRLARWIGGLKGVSDCTAGFKALRAEKHLRTAIELNPRYVPAFLNLGESFRRRGHYKEALEAYFAALRIDPDYPLPHVGMGYVLFGLKRYKEAVSSMERALSLKPDLPMAPRLHLLAGQALRKLGRREEAERHLRRAEKLGARQK